MLAAERQEMVLRLLRQDRFASVSEIARLAGASVATVRRDLARLAEEGMLERVRGGAAARPRDGAAARPRDGAAARPTSRPEHGGPAGPPTPQLPLERRLGIDREQKRRIARRATAMCTDGETIMVDGGSTTQQLAPFLRRMRLRVITNSFAIAGELLSGAACTVVLGGGVVHPDSLLVLDPFTEEPFADYAADTVFMGVYGIDETGATNTDELLIRTERAMIGRARRLVVLADSGKFGRRGSLWLCGFDRIAAVVTDEGVPQRYRELLAERGVELVVA